ncbi:hypothetical protein C0992_001672 [Termitomyces sp. T32_za158]|nr:hypothetical protein C0992_001672 [Termitomyces sp. T32_za158]
MQVLPTASRPEPPLSAFSRDPKITGIDPAAVNLRDSVSTQLSRQSSSIYPPSNSTTSEPDSPQSPQSVVYENDRNDTSYDPVVNETQIYEGDDVAYRLQLLVNNNYFLPPAHSKPSAADFAAMEKTVQKKPSTPTFFERLRGKSKSKPTTPTGPSPGFDPTGPALRTAADSITSAQLRPQPPRVSSQFQRGPPPETRTGRVVVVREKIEDVAVAAKQAEQEMRARALRRDQDSPDGRITFPDVIDPTDIVDLPPPSSKYPFAVQASALCGLGVQDSLGAALLADHLPPPQSPGMSVSDREDHWRKALLHEAVHHSLDNTPDTSFSMLQGTSTPLTSPLVERLQSSVAPETHSMPLLDQRIISDPRFSNIPLTILRKKSSHSITFASSKSRSSRQDSRKLSPSSGVLPLRSTTPSEPLTPLTPAPRKHVLNLSHSTSQSRPEHNSPPAEASSRATLRRAVSSPSLSEVYGSGAPSSDQTPPPLPTPTQSFVSLNEKPSRITLQSFTTENDHELVDGDSTPRRSFAMSAIEGRVSLSSDYSQPSPTMSAFLDAAHDINGSIVNQARRQHSADHLTSSNESSVARYSAMSPPPRISSSLAYFALSPPPRSAPHNYQIRSTPSPHVSETSDAQQPLTSLTDNVSNMINAQELTSLSSPLSQRRGHPIGMQLSLNIPPTDITVAIHSAPGPSSPTSFFDAIQSQPSAMDDLETSDDSDEEVDVTPLDAHDSNPYSPSVSAPPVTSRPSLMRLGNHSTPYVSHTKAQMRRPSTGIKDKKPVGNIPVRVPFFRDRAGKSDQGHGPPVSSFDFYKYAQISDTAVEVSRSAGITGRRSTVGNVSAWKPLNPKAQESLKKLDGMLIQHMAAERDTIKQGQPPIVKGRLYNHVNTTNSVWQLEPRKQRLTGRERTASTVSTTSTQSSYALVSDPEISSSFAASLESGQVSDAEDISPSPAHSSPTSDERILPPFSHRNTGASRSASPGHALPSMTSSYTNSLESLSASNSGKLLTLHLEKELSIIWPSLIVGPAPDYLSPPVTDSVLFNASIELEHQYNMDPTSLVLLGLEQFDIRKEKDEAFEYFIRAWHQAHVPTASMRLASHYVPVTSTYDFRVSETPEPRGTTAYYLQCLGGQRGLAQLYTDAGLLHLEGAATTLLSVSYSSLSSLRVPLHAQVGEGGTEAWMRDRSAAAEYFERAQSLDHTLEIPTLPQVEPHYHAEELEMPYIDIKASEPGSRSDVSHNKDVHLRRRKKKEDVSLYNSSVGEDDADNTCARVILPGPEIVQSVDPESDEEPVEESSADALEEGDFLEDFPDETEDLDLVHARIGSLNNLRLPRFANYLKRLCLRQNFVSFLDPEVFSMLTNLEELDLYDNKLKSLGDALLKLSKLETLDLSFNLLKTIPEGLASLISLHTIYVVQNRISKINGFESCINLRSLELGGNRIRRMENMESLVNLEELWLGKNKITKIENLGTMKKLRILSLQSNRITRLENLEELVNLEQLYLSHNGVKKLEGLEKNTKLTTLDLGNNFLPAIENISHLTCLEELWINGNEIPDLLTLEPQLGAIKSLETLYLEANPCQTKDMTGYRRKIMLTLPQLKQIDAT